MPPMRAVGRSFLRFPLRWKLIGANAVLLTAGLFALLLMPPDTAGRNTAVVVLFVAAVVNVTLVLLALAPLLAVQHVAAAVIHGDYGSRIPPQPLEDREAERARLAINGLLDHVAADNARVRRLAGEAAQAREAERTAMAHELREGVAQLLFALTMELAATAREGGEPLSGARARAAYELAQAVMEDVRRLAGSLAPAALAELGLEPALEGLARRTASSRDGLQVLVRVEPETPPAPMTVALPLYRVAERALRNARAHADVARATVCVRHDASSYEMYVEDDGVAVDPRGDEPLAAEPGLFGVREMISQAGGELRFDCSRTGRGTRVLARLPAPRVP